HALASVVLLGSQPSLVAVDREAQYPVFAEFLLELAHVGLEVGWRLACGAAILVGSGCAVRVLPMRDLLGDGPGQERDGAAVEAGLDALLQVVRQFVLVSRELFLGAILARAGI